MKVFADLKTRGGQDLLIAVSDGLKGMSESFAVSRRRHYRPASST